ncbi:efflux RND transporter permease subunit [Marivivens niveibacter]|uniref:efflux RND transporter permease subunit n=1 Tax=Marivivens niveibacter TaxID=1930667 RepID=UPI000A3C9C90|nr:efflux RND transporter permease subunit [Marivivens niveibacter]
MKGFNLSDWALNHKSFVWFLMILSTVAGLFAYTSMGREEDPDFTIRTMVVTGVMPGATASETLTQVTDRIEKKLEQLDTLDATRSVTYAGHAVVYVDLLETVRGAEIEQSWTKVRAMMSDIRGEFPSEFKGFVFNDNFGDVFGNIYAFTWDGYTSDEVKTYVENIADNVQLLDAAGRVELVGLQERKVFVEFSDSRLAALGLDAQTVLNTLAAQNQIVPSGTIDTSHERIAIRINGQFDNAAQLASAPLRSGDTFFTLSDVANVIEGYENPPSSLFRYNGQQAIALTIGMRGGENILDFGAELNALMEQEIAALPIGIDVHHVADQPHVVEESIGHFVKALIEAVAIVLAVSFVSLGMRAGFVVTLTIPLVLAVTFVILDAMGITLQRISLGALIIALGLLVDDAMIAIETMISRLEVGDSLTKAASYAWTSIAFPMLTGTLVTVAGFIPIGLNDSQAGEYTNSLFWVIAVSLVISWFVAVLFAPILGVAFLPAQMKHHTDEPGRLRRMFRSVLNWAMRAKWLTIAITAAAFGLSLFGMKYVEQQFFPTGDRPEVLVDVTLRQNASINATDDAMRDFETWLSERPEPVFWTTYVGEPAPRFVLTLQGPTASPSTGQIVIQTGSIADRNTLADAVGEYSDANPAAEFFPTFISLGPPSGKPVQYRVAGPDYDQLRDHARRLAAIMEQDDRLASIGLDWNEPTRTIKIDLNQARLRQLGLTKADVGSLLLSLYEGTTVTQLRDGTALVDVVVRGTEDTRQTLSALENLQVAGADGTLVPLASFATLEWTTEPPMIKQEGRVPTITVSAAINTDDQPATIVNALAPQLADYAASLPNGYKVEVGGPVESSAESQAPIIAVVPIMLVVLLILVMAQVQSFRLMFIVLAVAPLGLIGVVAALLLSGAPLGFVAILGVLALVGILIRNSIILVQAIEDLRALGKSQWDAVTEASEHRARPILLTAAAASLALIPISHQIFWGPMAYAMMGGIIAGTLITLLFVPALYCAVYGLTSPKR